jgi:phage shock protein C
MRRKRFERFDRFTDSFRNRLYRDSENGVLFGVCAGLADYFGFDLKITRICVAAGAIFFFPTVIVIYVILGLLLEDMAAAAPRERRREDPELRRRVRSEPHSTLLSVRHRYRELERRLQRLEKHVTSKKYNLQREIDGLGD